MAATIKSLITTIMQALAKVSSPQNRIKTVRPNNDYTAQVTTFLKTTLTSFTASINSHWKLMKPEINAMFLPQYQHR